MGWGASPCPQTSTVTDQNYKLIENNLLSASLSAVTPSINTSLASTWLEHQTKLASAVATSPFYTAAAVAAAQHNSALNLQSHHLSAVDKNLNVTQFPSPSIPPSVVHSEKKSYTPCRYQQDKLDFFSGFGANILPSETVSSSRSYPPSSPYTSSSSTSSLHESSPSASSVLHQPGHYTPGNYHIQCPPNPIHDTTVRSCALPSPTIYPPTPPPSAPWIHPWFVGDTF